MDEKLRIELCNNLNNRGGAVLAFPIPELFELLEELFTEQEAALAAKMPPAAVSAKDLANTLSTKEADLVPVLESMTDKGTVLDREKDGVTLYKLLPLLPGIFEFQFMGGKDSEHHRRLARLFKDYIGIAEDKMRQLVPIPEDMTSFARVIPVERSIDVGPKIYTFHQLSKYIEDAEAISVGHCYCRHQASLLGEEPCEAPRESCFSFGPGAKYITKHGLGRMVSKDEALEILGKCEESGLIHLTSNTSYFLKYVCNCCGCHCDSLKKIKETGLSFYGANSGYYPEIDSEACIGCGTCEEHCQMDAIAVNEDETAELDQGLCLGCGACASLCPSEAITMRPNESIKEPPKTSKDLRASVAKDLRRGAAEAR